MKNNQQVNMFVLVNGEYHVCIDCADGYFCEEELKNYKAWCKKNKKKIAKKIIDQIKKNEL